MLQTTKKSSEGSALFKRASEELPTEGEWVEVKNSELKGLFRGRRIGEKWILRLYWKGKLTNFERKIHDSQWWRYIQ